MLILQFNANKTPIIHVERLAVKQHTTLRAILGETNDCMLSNKQTWAANMQQSKASARNTKNYAVSQPLLHYSESQVSEFNWEVYTQTIN